MNKKLFVDSDIILDLLAERPLFEEEYFTARSKKERERGGS
jgi:hypothetical protein